MALKDNLGKRSLLLQAPDPEQNRDSEVVTPHENRAASVSYTQTNCRTLSPEDPFLKTLSLLPCSLRTLSKAGDRMHHFLTK